MKKKIIKQPNKFNNNLVVYQTKSGSLELRGDFTHETIWATQAQIAKLFNVSPQNITLHLKNIYKDGELSMKATCKDYLQVQIEGNRKISRQIEFYNLDAIIAVGYRVNSKNATQFRIWATKTLREHILKGFTINKKVLIKNHKHFLKTVSDIHVQTIYSY